MPVDISGAGTITGLQSEGISSQPVFPGNVIQVVEGTTSTTVSVSSINYADTGLSASITPTSTSSTILILTNHYLNTGSDARGFGLQFLRDSTVISSEPKQGGGSFGPIATAFHRDATYTGFNALVNHQVVDNPNTTSAITYKTQMARHSDSGSVTINNYNDSTCPSIITLMEIAG